MTGHSKKKKLLLDDDYQTIACHNDIKMRLSGNREQDEN